MDRMQEPPLGLTARRLRALWKRFLGTGVTLSSYRIRRWGLGNWGPGEGLESARNSLGICSFIQAQC